METSSNGYIYKTLALRAQKTLPKMGHKLKESEDQEVCCEICLLGMSEDTPVKSHQRDCLNRNSTMTPTYHTKLEGEKPTKP